MFPFRRTPEAKPESDAAAPPVALIVEDEDLLRANAATMLEDMGFDVVSTANADEALAVMVGKPVELLLADIHMPGGRDGLALAREAAERWPEMRIVICSGRIRATAGQLPPGAVFVPKPYTVDDIEKAILSF